MLTFPIAEDVLRGCRMEQAYADGERLFTGLRFEADAGERELLYVYPASGGACIGSGSDKLLVKDMDAREAYRRLAAAMERIDAWERRLQEMIFSDCTLKDIVDASVPIFQNAIMVTDESNRILAMSEHGPGEVSEEWDYMLQNRSTELGLVLDIFRAEPFKQHAFSNDGKPFYFVPPGLATGGINCRIPSPDRKSVLGTALIMTNITPVSEGMLQTARIFSDAVCRWVRLHHRELPMASAPAVFSETLGGELLTEDRALLLYTAVLSRNEAYRVLCVRGLPRLMLDTCTRSLEAALGNTVCCQSEACIYVLISDEEHDALAAKAAALISSTGAHIGLGDRFTDLHRLGEYARQAEVAAAYGSGPVRDLSAESVMRYAAERMQKTPLRASIVHPALLTLDEYDRAHGTEFCKTLYVYLVNERRITDSLPALNIHRNTLLYRLKRLETLLEADLNDPAEREYLLLSFRMMRPMVNDG